MNGPHRRWLLDTNAVIALLQGHVEMKGLAGDAEWIGVSVLTEIEFLAFPGLSESDTLLFRRFLERVEIVNLAHEDMALLNEVVVLRRLRRLRLPDAIIAASAKANHATLVTADRSLLILKDDETGIAVRAFTP